MAKDPKDALEELLELIGKTPPKVLHDELACIYEKQMATKGVLMRYLRREARCPKCWLYCAALSLGAFIGYQFQGNPAWLFH